MYDALMTAIAANAVVLGALAYLFKSIITHLLNKDISTFKARIQSDIQKEIESFRSNLEKERLRLQISYGGIFEKQAEAILELNTNLYTFDDDINSAVHHGGDPTARKEAFLVLWRDLRN